MIRKNVRDKIEKLCKIVVPEGAQVKVEPYYGCSGCTVIFTGSEDYPRKTDGKPIRFGYGWTFLNKYCFQQNSFEFIKGFRKNWEKYLETVDITKPIDWGLK